MNLEQNVTLLFTVLIASWTLFILYLRAAKRLLIFKKHGPQPPISQVSFRVIAVGGLGGEFLSLVFLGRYMHALRLPFQDLFPQSSFEVYQPSCRQLGEEAADAIHARVSDDPRPLILIGHSKGGLDILHFLIKYPQFIGRVQLAVLANTPLRGSWTADWLTSNVLRPLGIHWPALESLTSPARKKFWTETWSRVPDWQRRLIAKRLHIVATEEFHSRTCAWPIAAWHYTMRKQGLRNDGLIGFDCQNLPKLTDFKSVAMSHHFHHHFFLTSGGILSNITEAKRLEILSSVFKTTSGVGGWKHEPASLSRIHSRRYRHLEVIK